MAQLKQNKLSIVIVFILLPKQLSKVLLIDNTCLKIIALSILLALPFSSLAQERDTTHRAVQEGNNQSLNLDRPQDRSVSLGAMSEMGAYNVPDPNPYHYERPFMGQKHLDRAVKAYREKMEEQFGENWASLMWAVNSLINLRFGPSQTSDTPIPGRGNPLWENYVSDKKKQ